MLGSYSESDSPDTKFKMRVFSEEGAILVLLQVATISAVNRWPGSICNCNGSRLSERQVKESQSEELIARKDLMNIIM